jgi:hypothetical protein
MFYMFRAVSPPIIRSSRTVHTASGTCQALLDLKEYNLRVFFSAVAVSFHQYGGCCQALMQCNGDHLCRLSLSICSSCLRFFTPSCPSAISTLNHSFLILHLGPKFVNARLLLTLGNQERSHYFVLNTPKYLQF